MWRYLTGTEIIPVGTPERDKDTTAPSVVPPSHISNWYGIWDHTFSEYWEADWEHYESYYWEWGATFYGTYDALAICPYEIRSDGLLTPVTHHYVNYSTLNITVLDQNDNPVDGAEIKLYVQRPDEAKQQCMVGYADNNGFYSFTVSDSFDYYAKIYTNIGNYYGYALLAENAETSRYAEKHG